MSILGISTGLLCRVRSRGNVVFRIRNLLSSRGRFSTAVCQVVVDVVDEDFLVGIGGNVIGTLIDTGFFNQ